MNYLTKDRHIDNNFYRLTTQEAKALCSGQLPKIGYEKRVEVEGFVCWVTRTTITPYDKERFYPPQQVWALHRTYAGKPIGPFPLKIASVWD